MARPDAQYPVLIWALTIRGEMMAVHCTTRAEALEIGRANVASGAWRTWDAFESAGDETEIEARRIASSSLASASEAEPAKESIARPRILADWMPPAATEVSEAPVVPAEVVGSSRAPTVKESLKAFRAAASAEKPKGAAQEKPKAPRRRRIIPE